MTDRLDLPAPPADPATIAGLVLEGIAERWAPPPPAEIVTSRYRRRGVATADAAGLITVELGSPPFDAWWLVDRIVFRSSAALEAKVFTGAVDPNNEIDNTTAGELDARDYPRGLYVAGGAALLVEWSNAAAGVDTGYASAQVVEMRRG